MHRLNIGDTVQNSTQHSVVRWLGEIEGIPIIGLQSIDSTLPGYTDGTCPFDNNRYFHCPNGQGYYILETGLNDSYEIIKTSNAIDSDDSPERSLSASPKHAPISSQPIQSVSSPIVSQSQYRSDNKTPTSPSRGVLSRLAFEREQRKNQVPSPTNSLNQTSSIELTPRSSRRYQPDNYKSTSYDRTEKPEWSTHNSDDENGTINNQQDVPLFGHEYFLNNWTLGRVKNLLDNQIPLDNQLCLNVYDDQRNVRNLIDEQINGCLSLLPSLPPNDVRIELIKLYDHVEIIFPSRAIYLYENDYLLLAILCSNNSCAYIRTSNGWAYTDNESDHGESIIIDEISQMIDDADDRIQFHSEQCRHVLKNASFLYYKRVK